MHRSADAVGGWLRAGDRVGSVQLVRWFGRTSLVLECSHVAREADRGRRRRVTLGGLDVAADWTPAGAHVWAEPREDRPRTTTRA